MRRFQRIEVENRRAFVAATAVLALVLGAHTILEVARDALFLARLPAEELPFTYLGIAAAAYVAAQLDRRLLAHVAKRRLLALTMCAAAVGTVAFFVLFQTGGSWVPHVFYVWTGLVATFAVTQFWRLTGEAFTVGEAKRLYSWIAAGGSVGALLGAALANVAVQLIGASGLLLVSATIMLGTAAVALFGLPRGDDEDDRDTAPDRVAGTGRSSGVYLRMLLALVLLASVTATLIDFVFKSTVAANLSGDELGVFFGRFYVGLNAVALVAQVVLAPRLLRVLGANRSMAVLPGLLVLGAAGAWAGSLAAVVLLRGADGGLRHSLYRSSLELLYLPLPKDVRDRNKAVIDAFGQRGGQALGSVAILALGALQGWLATTIPARHLAPAIAVLSAGWVMIAIAMRGRYVDLFRANLKEGSIETRPEVPELDLSSLEYLMASLNSERDEEVLATLGFLKDYQRVHLVPALLLYHPSPQVVLRALDLFAESDRGDYLGVARRLLDHDDEEIRAAAIRALVGALDEKELRKLLDEQRTVTGRAAVLVALVSRGLDRDGEARKELEDCALGSSLLPRRALARAIRLQRDTSLTDLLTRMARDPDPELRIEIAKALTVLREPLAVPLMIRWIGDRAVRPHARAALVAHGQVALKALRRALDDGDLPLRVRGHVPRTISRFPTPEAGAILLARLDEERDGWVRFKILRGLRNLRDLLPDLSLSSAVLNDHAARNLRRATQVLGYAVALGRAQRTDPSLRTQGGELLAQVLQEKVQQSVERTVRLIALAHPEDDLTSIRHALRHGDRRLRSEGRELLANLAPFDLAPAVEALLDDREDPVRYANARRALDVPAPPALYVPLLRTLLEDESESIRVMAAFHIGELGLTELAADLEAARAKASDALGDVVDRALEELGRQEGGALDALGG